VRTIEHPVATAFPATCPDAGLRGDREAYAGVQLKAWASDPDVIEVAMVAPAGAPAVEVTRALRRLLAHLDAAALPRTHPDLPPSTGRVVTAWQLDLGTTLGPAAGSVWGPSLLRSAGTTAGTVDAAALRAAAAAYVRGLLEGSAP
jgi:hypothetical protein